MPTPTEQAQIRAIARGIERVTERAVIKISLDVTAELIEANPVDTGWSRANWIPQIGAPREDPVGERPSSGQTFEDVAAQAAGQAAVLGYRLPQGAVWVTNNVPYINRLNAGHSPQAEAGFVERAIAAAVEAAERSKLDG